LAIIGSASAFVRRAETTDGEFKFAAKCKGVGQRKFCGESDGRNEKDEGIEFLER
jgi:hypothetical protein